MERDTGYSETTVAEHAHVCVDCGDIWKHQVPECENLARAPHFHFYATYARCPIHELDHD